MGTELYLIRHAEAHTQLDHTADGQDAGAVLVGGLRGDRGLTPHGRLQAEALRNRLATSGEVRADAIYASTFARARQTAEIVAPALGLPVTLDDDLQELRPGEADGLTVREAEARYGVFDLRRDPYTPFAPGGENWGQFVLRVGVTLDRIVRTHPGQTVALFTHGGFVDVSFLVFFNMNTLTPPSPDFYTRNTSITHWSRREHLGESQWRLERYNDDLHVRGIGAERPLDWAALRPTAEREGLSLPLPTEASIEE